MKVKYLFLALTSNIPHIKNLNYPVCAKCVHYDEFDHHNPIPEYSRCKKFGKMDLVSGQIKYDYASICRDNDDKCGEKGFFYEEKPKED
jgi:hypothetical protein